MKNSTLEKIDQLSLSIKKKNDAYGTAGADVFIIFTFEIARNEIAINKLTDYTISALCEISATTSHFYYYRDYRALYDELQDCYNAISRLDRRFFDADLPSPVNFELNTWQKYISTATNNLLAELPKTFIPNPDL